MATSRANDIADALVHALKVIAHNQDPGEWLTSPKKVARGLVVGDLMALERPRIAVQVLSWRSTPTGPQTHDCTMRLGVHVIVDGDERAEVNLNNCVRDILKAVVADETLENHVTDIQPVEYVPQAEVMERTGLGIATVVFDAIFVWEHAAP